MASGGDFEFRVRARMEPASLGRFFLNEPVQFTAPGGRLVAGRIIRFQPPYLIIFGDDGARYMIPHHAVTKFPLQERCARMHEYADGLVGASRFREGDLVKVTFTGSIHFNKIGRVRSTGIRNAIVIFDGDDRARSVRLEYLAHYTRQNQAVNRLACERARVREDLERLRRKDAELAERIRRAESLPNLSDAPVGTLLTFTKRFASSPRGYSYAVLKADNGFWYATSNNTHQMTTEEFYAFLAEGVDYSSIMLVIGKTPLTEIREW